MPKKATKGKRTTSGKTKRPVSTGRNETTEHAMTPDPVCMLGSETLVDAARAMRENDIGDVIVLDDTGGRVKGIVTDRDIVVRAIANDDDPSRTVLASVCTSDVVCVGPGESLDTVVELMRDKAIRRVPVVEDDHAVGILSIGDLAQRLDERSALAEISAAPPKN